MNKYLLDTNSIIYALQKGLKFPRGEYFISIITEIELLSYSKLTPEDERNIKLAISNFKLIELTNNIKNKTIDIRKKIKLKLPDSIIVASAKQYDLTLVTSDSQLLSLKNIEVIEIFEL